MSHVALDASLSDPTPLPVQKLSAAQACERALRKVQAYTTNDAAPDPDQMIETLNWFDMIVAHLTGTRACYWLRPQTVIFEWPAGEPSAVLADLMGADYPPQGILFPVRAWCIDPGTGLRREELELCRRKRYEEKSNQATAGTPQILFIDRLVDDQRAYPWPVPSSEDPTSIGLEFQTYSRSVMGEQGNTDQAGDVPTGFDATWNLYLVTRLAAEIGDGPVLTLEQGRIRDWRAIAEALYSDLIYHNREKNSRPYQTRRYGG